MKWYTRLYLGDGIDDNIHLLKNELFRKKKYNQYHLIILPANKNNLLDIISVKEAKKITWRDLFIIGVGKSNSQAVHITKDIITEIYNNTGDFNIEGYFTDYDWFCFIVF